MDFNQTSQCFFFSPSACLLSSSPHSPEYTELRPRKIIAGVRAFACLSIGICVSAGEDNKCADTNACTCTNSQWHFLNFLPFFAWDVKE